MAGWPGRLLKEWTIVAPCVVGTGLPETPVYLAAVPGTGYTGTIRPDPPARPSPSTLRRPARTSIPRLTLRL